MMGDRTGRPHGDRAAADRANFMRAKAARRSEYERQNVSRRVYVLIRTAIRKGYLARGESLEESRLMSDFAAPGGAVRAALGRLARDGLLRRSPGAGTHVEEFFVGVEVGRPQETTGVFEIETLFSGLVPGAPGIREQLCLPEDSPVRVAEYLLHTEGRPYCVETIYWAPTTAPRVPFVAASGDDLPTAFRRHFGVALGDSTTAIDAVVGDAATTASLGVPAGTPLLLSEKLLTGADGVPRELQYIHYPAGRTYFIASTDYETEIRP
ncbi:GntR family transcriptional regulator [Microbacterium excoecariae]|uniref:GntR family transcriptional regulator n=1 Tax=Microbacterium excoecariae TaxID=2715210 RepID=UPI00140CDA0B|nr:GntR family transcriptional regulator [Microbacterium excoecariae]NHI17685.1 GntR family transcriptional regulator [Microbacterium excoecariae]